MAEASGFVTAKRVIAGVAIDKHGQFGDPMFGITPSRPEGAMSSAGRFKLMAYKEG